MYMHANYINSMLSSIDHISALSVVSDSDTSILPTSMYQEMCGMISAAYGHCHRFPSLPPPVRHALVHITDRCYMHASYI